MGVTFADFYPMGTQPDCSEWSKTSQRLVLLPSVTVLQWTLLGRTGGKIVVADQIYRGRFLFARKNCENNKNTDFATLFLVLQQRKRKRKLQT
jgi:hypothetical protein